MPLIPIFISVAMLNIPPFFAKSSNGVEVVVVVEVVLVEAVVVEVLIYPLPQFVCLIFSLYSVRIVIGT